MGPGGRRNPALRAGAPFVALVVVGWLGLSQLVAGRNEQFDSAHTVGDDRAPVVVQKRKGALSLEEEHKRLQQRLNIDAGYEMKSIPRLKEDDE